MATSQTHELPVGLPETRRCACWCCWRVRRWLCGDHNEYDHAVIVLPASESEAPAPPPPQACPHDADPTNSEDDVRRACPELIMHRSDGVVHPWRAPPRMLGLPVGCLRAVRDGLEDMLARVAERHADAGAPGWVAEAEERECVHG